MLNGLLQQSSPQVAVMPFNWQEWQQFHPTAAESPLLTHLISKEVAFPDMDDSRGRKIASLSRDRILSAEPGKRQKLLESYLLEHLARVLNISSSELDIHQPLNNLGIDSLMAVELKNLIEVELSVIIPMVRLLQGPNIAQFASLLLDQMTGVKTDIASASEISVKPMPGAQKDEISNILQKYKLENFEELSTNVDQLSDEEVETMLYSLMEGKNEGDEKNE
jgi:acyl carrier protein